MALYRISSVLLLLFAIGHTVGFSAIDPKWGVDSLVRTMQSVHFNANGSDRTYWDFFVGFGLFVSVLMVLAAVVAWQLGELQPATLAQARIVAWGFVGCFVLVTWLSWRYFFVVPVIFSALILICPSAAAWVSGKSS